MTTSAPEIDEKEAELVEAEEADQKVESNPAGEFSLVIIDEAKPTVDNRYFVEGAVTWRDPPIPLLFTTTNGNGHKGGEVGGAITKIWREDGKVKGSGHFESGERGQELRRLIDEGVLTGVSADVGGALVAFEAATDTTKEMQRITEGKILGVTALPLQAYDDTRIAVTAAAIPVAPPKDWFTNPSLKKVTPLSVSADGHVFGHVAAWGTCHVGASQPGKCLEPPHSGSGYAHFKIGEVLTAEGDTIATGPITLGTGHAGLSLNANSTRAHYDDTGTAVADVTAGEDEFGIWVAGAMRPNVTDDRIREFRASAPSGDWRPIGGQLELVGVLAVNVPGFPVLRAQAEFANGEPLALVAAGAVPVEEFEAEEEDCGCSEAVVTAIQEAQPSLVEADPEMVVQDGPSLEAELTALEEQMESLAARILAEGELRNYTIPNKKSTPKEIVGHHGHHPHGTSILWPAMYEELRKKAMSKAKAARISNARWNDKHGAPGNATSTRFDTTRVVEFVNLHTDKEKRDRNGRWTHGAGEVKAFLKKVKKVVTPGDGYGEGDGTGRSMAEQKARPSWGPKHDAERAAMVAKYAKKSPPVNKAQAQKNIEDLMRTAKTREAARAVLTKRNSSSAAKYARSVARKTAPKPDPRLRDSLQRKDHPRGGEPGTPGYKKPKTPSEVLAEIHGRRKK